MPTARTGVYPVYENQFKIAAAGSSSAPSTPIADMTTFSVAFNNGVEEWNAFENEGWKSRLMTAKDVVISIKGKRNLGDAGNDMIADCAFKNGTQAQRDLLWTFPDGATVLFANAVINVTACGSGDSTNVGSLEFDVMSNGKPTYTAAPAGTQ